MEVPPLVANHAPWLPPVGPNHMFNAVIKSANFGGDWIERTLVSDDHKDLETNIKVFDGLLSGKLSRAALCAQDPDGSTYSYHALVGVVDHKDFLDALNHYRWGVENESMPLVLEREFLAHKHLDPEVDEWVVISPLLQKARLGTKQIAGEHLTCVARSRVDNGLRFKAFSTPLDRTVAASLVKGPFQPCPGVTLDLKVPRRGVLLLYAVYDKDSPLAGLPTMGLSFIPPVNKSPKRRTFGVRNTDASDSVVI
jgi:hypothetical protein